MRPLHIAGMLLCALAGEAQAQIAGDGSLGTAISRTGNAWSIGAGTQLGGNLFQSFSQFNLPTGQSATFSGAGSVSNIVGRVTGPNASSIDGLLRSTIPGASLWLMNPRGVMFGPNARLDIGGSLHFSTADYLRLGSGAAIVYAALSANSTLSSAPPSAFGFLGAVRAPISINGSRLQPLAGVGLSLTGGDILLTDATLLAPGGRIDISGDKLSMQNSSLDTVTSGAARSGDIRIAATDVTLAGGSLIDASTWGAGRAGDITIAASGRLSIVRAAINSDSNDAHTGDAGAVSISASVIDIGRAGYVSSDTYGAGNAGSLAMNATSLSITGGGQIGSTTFGKGRGGIVSIQAAGLLSISGTSPNGQHASGIFADTQRVAPAGGDAGLVSVTADSIRLSDGGLISTSTFGSGNAGNLSVTARDIDMASGGQFLGGQFLSSTYGAGRGGNIDVAASGRLSIAGADYYGNGSGSGIFSSTSDGSTGAGGAVTVSAGSLSLDQDGTIASDTAGAGRAGDVSVRAGSISLTNGGRISSSTVAAGRGGNVTVVTPGRLFIADDGENSQSGIFADTRATGNGGSVAVNAGSIELASGGLISAETIGAGRGGDISIVSDGRLSIAGSTSMMTGIVGTTWRTGDAGAIRIRVAELVINGDQQTTIGSSALFGSGNAGSIVIDTGSATIAGQAFISTSARGSGGRAGSIVITASGDVLLVGDPAAAARFGGISTNGISSHTESSGPAGTITLSARNLSITDLGGISTESDRTGIAGNIFINVAGVLRLSGGGTITTSARSADGGNISIKAGTLVYLKDSQITTSVNTSTGSGGNIAIDPTFVVLDHSQIIAQAAQGSGGNINIVSEFFLSFDSLVDASSQKGVSGSVVINSPNVNTGSGLVVQSANYLDASGMMRQSCAARAGLAASSSFTGAGRGGLSPAPGAARHAVAASGVAAGPMQLSLHGSGCGS